MALTDKILSVTLILLVLEGTRRVLGPALPITAIAFLLYAYFFTRIEPIRVIDQLYLSTEGIFGQPLAVSASYVMIFVLFGAFMERTGTGQLFMDFAMGITGHTAGGPGKVSVVSSSLFGTISGSAVANVMVDGPISIPLMKRTGFKAHFAAAVEATASTGGQIMPPIMGAAAFVMAEFQGVSYAQIVIWATIPAILYYVACFAAVHFEAKRQGLLGVPRSELPPHERDAQRTRPLVHSRAARSCSSCTRATARRWRPSRARCCASRSPGSGRWCCIILPILILLPQVPVVVARVRACHRRRAAAGGGGAVCGHHLAVAVGRARQDHPAARSSGGRSGTH